SLQGQRGRAGRRPAARAPPPAPRPRSRRPAPREPTSRSPCPPPTRGGAAGPSAPPGATPAAPQLRPASALRPPSMRLYHAPRVRPPRDRPLPRPRLDGTRQQRRVPHLPRGGPDRLPLRPRRDDRLPDRRARRDRLPLAGPPRRDGRGRRPLHAARNEELRPRVRAPRRRARGGGGPQRPGLLRLRPARGGRAPRELAAGAHGVTAFERHTLRNGVRVLTAPMPQAQSVTCALM